MKHIVYRITNTINGRYYIGAHSTDDIDDGYMGSGELIKKAIEKYGIGSFTKEVLFEAASAHEMYEKEKELVMTVYDDPLSYNMNGGGKGGWGHINKDPGRINAMHMPGVAEKVSITRKKRFAEDADFRCKTQRAQRKATRAAARANSGKKRPEHAALIKEMHSAGQLGYPMRIGSVFEVIDSEGRNYIVSDLKRFCYDNDIPYVSLWRTSKEGTPLKRGKAKGWFCKLIKKGHYEYNESQTRIA